MRLTPPLTSRQSEVNGMIRYKNWVAVRVSTSLLSYINMRMVTFCSSLYGVFEDCKTYSDFSPDSARLSYLDWNLNRIMSNSFKILFVTQNSLYLIFI